MTTIWKFPLPIADEFVVMMPKGAEVLHVDVQGESQEFGLSGTPCLWALVDSQAPAMDRRFAWRGTGHDVAGLSAGQHVGSVLFHGGGLVFHLFERDA